MKKTIDNLLPLAFARCVTPPLLLLLAACTAPAPPIARAASTGEKPPALEPPSTERRLSWPPVVGQPYPDLALRDRRGQVVPLSSFRGKVVLLEPIGMTCPACQAFCGARRKGAFRGVTPQRDLASIEELFPRFAGGLTLSDPRIVYIQLLLYNSSMGAPSPADVAAWTDHFGPDSSPNTLVFAGEPGLVGPASFNMIPGFQLIDQLFVLRLDSTGHRPRHDLYRELLPQIPQLLAD